MDDYALINDSSTGRVQDVGDVYAEFIQSI
jgi:hypothetical protein